MLTVLVKFRELKRECVFEASSVEMQEGDGPAAGLLLVRDDGGSSQIPASQTSDDVRDVFVMNGAGATVARYVL